MSSTAPTPGHKWEELLIDKDVIVLTKSTFFRTVNLLFQFADAPDRHTWEFFNYPPWEYILGTWCTTLDIDASALSCGAQHPFIYRDGDTLRYALPDYVLMSHGTDAEGKQEAWPLLVVEIKALARLEPDTDAARKDARDTFIKTWKQRTNQARLALQSHPALQDVHIMMVSGPWFAPYIYQRSELMPQPPGGAHSLRDSPPRKKWRRMTRTNARDLGDDPDREDQPTVKPFDTKKDAKETVAVGNRHQQRRTLRQTKGKRKRDAELEADPHVTTPVVNHVFQLGPNTGERNALNPWFLRLLGQMKERLGRSRGTFRTQNSWFDWPAETIPEGDGHAEGFVLPATELPAPKIEVEGVREVVRLDEDPIMVSVPSTPGNQREALNTMQLNALLSPRIHRTPRVFGGGIDVPPAGPEREGSTDSEATLPAQHPETQPSESDSESDDAATPKADRGLTRPSRGSSSYRDARELSPSDAYLERRQHGPLHPPQLPLAPPDSSPPHFTPQKQLLWFDTADESDSQPLAGYDASGPAPFPRPASAPPTASSPPPHTSHSPTAVNSTSRGHEPRPGHLHQDHVSRPTPPSRPHPPLRAALPSRRFQPPGAARRGAPIRQLTEKMGDLNVSSDGPRKTATAREWHRKPPTKDELLLLAMNAPRGADGQRSRKQAYLNAGMTEDQAALACRRFDDVHASKATGSGGSGTTTTFAVPPLHTQRRPGIDTSGGGGGVGQLARSGGATGPSTTSGGASASASRPPPMDRASETRTASRSESDTESESLNDHFPDDAPSPTVVLTPASVPPTPSSQASDTPRDLESVDSRDHRVGGGPPIRRTDPSSALPGPNPDPGPLGTNATRKGKERQR